jgi:hypothetical protein
MSDFAKTYRTLVVPRLKQRFDICAALVVSEISSFSAEIGHLEHQAWRLGGSHLADREWFGLTDWMATQVVEAVTRIELGQAIPGAHRDVLAIFHEQERIITDQQAEIDRLSADLAMAWMLAATSPATTSPATISTMGTMQ